jgi:hypothetical protein
VFADYLVGLLGLVPLLQSPRTALSRRRLRFPRASSTVARLRAAEVVGVGE